MSERGSSQGRSRGSYSSGSRSLTSLTMAGSPTPWSGHCLRSLSEPAPPASIASSASAATSGWIRTVIADATDGMRVLLFWAGQARFFTALGVLCGVLLAGRL